MRKQLQLRLEFHPRPRRRKLKLKRAAAGSPQCQNLLRKRGVAGNHYFWLPSEQCRHHGRLYSMNGFRMVLCVCCA